ncbi:hypothetical protein BEP19_06495 [Ammoniphilus oxalaticus]|uniref:HTH tetR-type domain-containing protein n=1 Tax=Ammoniphilus oxalaticus TaxID=66863 RepID=A0A419SJ69_9BACL|nr:TetR/AcrR family transcriptional regulator [Ammoniphilus oxalaticus]RKD24053.1 hypothetical protein BEP19_06495 [Ammoniphilus oxalaticus]
MGKPKRITKEDFIHAVKQQLLQEGQAKVTLKNVAEQAGVTQGALYYHFKTKDCLLLSLLIDYLENSVPQELKPFQQLNGIEALEAYLKETEYQTHIRAEQQQLLFDLIGLALHNREMKQTMGQVMQQRVQEMNELAQQSEASGRILRALLDGLALQAIFDPGFDAKQSFEEVRRLFLDRK